MNSMFIFLAVLANFVSLPYTQLTKSRQTKAQGAIGRHKESQGVSVGKL